MLPEEMNVLKEALKTTPENISLRLMLANAMLEHRHFEEAEIEYKTLLMQKAGGNGVKSSLARTYYLQGKMSMAAAILDEIYNEKDLSAETHLMYAKVLAAEFNIERAREEYETAYQKNKSLRDTEFEKKLGGIKIEVIEEPKISVLNPPDERTSSPTVTFKDVGGMEDVKEEIRMKIIHPITHEDLYKAYGKKSGGGILLYGPPGCGKTFIAKATAGEVKARFINVGINDIFDKYIGVSEDNVHKVFELARQNAPCVLFFDEVDALAHNRETSFSGFSQTINQFLSEMDGVDGNNEGVLIMAATNAPWKVDAAFRRPGRFDELIFVSPPDAAAREEVLKLHLKGKPCGDIVLKEIAEKAKDFSGADLRGLVDHVVEAKLRASFKSGKVEHITQADLQHELTKTMPSTREWLATARNYALYANESGAYTGVLDYINNSKKK